MRPHALHQCGARLVAVQARKVDEHCGAVRQLSVQGALVPRAQQHAQHAQREELQWEWEVGGGVQVGVLAGGARAGGQDCERGGACGCERLCMLIGWVRRQRMRLL